MITLFDFMSGVLIGGKAWYLRRSPTDLKGNDGRGTSFYIKRRKLFSLNPENILS